MSEAEAHPGVSLVVAYAPCALQGPDGGMSKSQTVRRLALPGGERAAAVPAAVVARLPAVAPRAGSHAHR